MCCLFLVSDKPFDMLVYLNEHLPKEGFAFVHLMEGLLLVLLITPVLFVL